MLLGHVSEHAQHVWDIISSEIKGSHAIALLILSLFASLWMLWRLWRFIITPALHPDDPKELPYWVPILGHGMAFFNNSNALLSFARKKLNNGNEPFALTIAGSKIYVITKSEDVAEAYRNTDTLSFNQFVQAMMRACGNSESCVQAMYTPLPKDKEGFPNPHEKPLATLARGMHIHQLYPGERLDFLEKQFLTWFDNHLNIEELEKACPYSISSTDTAITLPLMEWCSDGFTRAGQKAYFGDALARIDPTLTKTFIVFDELSWQVLYQYPDFLAREMKQARDTITRALLKYIQLPQSHRSGDAWFTKAMENEMRALNICEEDIARMLVTIYWGINTNTRKAAFWLLTYLLHRPALIQEVREETLGAIRQDGSIDLSYLHANSTKLDAMWNETIRMSAYSASVRFITEDTVIGGKVLRKGNRLMIPYRQLHFDDRVFGGSVAEFRPERFSEKANLTKSSNWRPFGGGNTMCPGRHIAKRSVLLFITMLLHRFDIEMDGHQAIPDAEEGKPVLGIMSIKDGQDLRVRLQKRKNA